MASPLSRLLSVSLPLVVALAGSCVVPPPLEEDTPPGLEAPALSPPADLDARERLAWWQSRIPRMGLDDRSEAQLCVGELQLELRQPDEARLAFLEAMGGELSRAERARAERGIGLSYYLDGRPGLGERRLRAALPDLDPPAAAEVSWLLDATASGSAAPEGLAYARMAAYVEGAGLQVRARPQAALAHAYYDLSRADWNAASMRGNHDPMGTPWRITVHHSAIPLEGDSEVLSKGAVRHIQTLHQGDKGWADVGYHFLIDRAGRVIEGRPLNVQGAHAGDSQKNSGNIGICVLGNFAAQAGLGPSFARAQQLTQAQWDALDRLVDQLRADFDIPAGEVHTHKEFTGTECPGPALIAWVKSYRRGR